MEAKVVVQAGTTPNLQSEMEQATARANNAAIRAETAAENIEALNTPYVEEVTAYGVQWDITNSNPKVTRIGNSSLHRSLPIQNRMRGCLLDDNGKVVKYLNPLDWTSEVRDGSKGQVMVELPMHYRKFETDGNIRRVKISEYPLAGYHQVPLRYVSAYEAALDRTNSSTPKLASVVNMSTAFRGGVMNSTGADWSDWDGTFRTLLGRPVTGVSLNSFRNYARNRNGAATAEWNAYTISVHEEIYWLYLIEYANRNCQAAYNAELDSNGYKQGGLGAGVTTLYGWSTFNNNSPFVPCGHTDALGNRTGVVVYAVPNDETGAWKDQSVPRYRGIENPFGHINKFADGINVMIKPNDDTNPTSDIYICDDPAKFSGSGYDGYICVGQEARTTGFVKDINFGEYGSITPKTVGGGSTSYFCDNHYTNIPSSTTMRCIMFGGNAQDGSSDGLTSMSSLNNPLSAATSFCSRLCFIPAKA